MFFIEGLMASQTPEAFMSAPLASGEDLEFDWLSAVWIPRHLCFTRHPSGGAKEPAPEVEILPRGVRGLSYIYSCRSIPSEAVEI